MQVRWCDFLISYLDSKCKNASYKEPFTRLFTFIDKNGFLCGNSRPSAENGSDVMFLRNRSAIVILQKQTLFYEG